jgi:hypothetical protein
MGSTLAAKMGMARFVSMLFQYDLQAGKICSAVGL